jgi:hypothetical protein
MPSNEKILLHIQPDSVILHDNLDPVLLDRAAGDAHQRRYIRSVIFQCISNKILEKLTHLHGICPGEGCVVVGNCHLHE